VGGSAGFASITTEAITDSLGGLSIDHCLGLLPISGCAHYSSPVRRKVYKKAVYNGDVRKGYGIDEGAAIHFVDGIAHRTVCNSMSAKAFSVEMVDGKLQHKRLPSLFLNEEENADNYIWSQEPFRERTMRKREERAHARSRAMVVHGQEIEEEVEEEEMGER
jgi:CRISPR/Cas system-associated exonuclease Cas4 (RecB family)